MYDVFNEIRNCLTKFYEIRFRLDFEEFFVAKKRKRNRSVRLLKPEPMIVVLLLP
jgi:hypothetical protein